MKLNHKQFIETFIITDLEKVVKVAPYLSFALMGSAITYLGGFLTGSHSSKDSKKNFDAAITRLFAFAQYSFGTSMPDFLYHQLCENMGRMLMPDRSAEYKIGFDSGKNIPHSEDKENKFIILQAEFLYADIKNAAIEVIAMIDAGKVSSEKMNETALTITDEQPETKNS